MKQGCTVAKQFAQQWRKGVCGEGHELLRLLTSGQRVHAPLWEHHRHVLREGRLFARGRHGTGSDVERIVEFVTIAANCATEGRASGNDDH